MAITIEPGGVPSGGGGVTDHALLTSLDFVNAGHTGFAEDPHTHAQSDVTGLVTDLAGKSDVGHGHAQADVTDLVTDLGNKSNVGHTHAQSDVTDLVTDLGNKSNVGHTHPQSDVTNLVTDLAAKALDSDLQTHISGTEVHGASGAVVGTTNAQELTNKTLTSPIIKGVKTVLLTDAATIATDAALGNHFRVTLGGNRTLGDPTNPTDGQKAVWELIQDATGSRILTLGPAFALGTDISEVVLTTTANKRDFLGAVYNSGTSKWYVVSFIKGY